MIKLISKEIVMEGARVKEGLYEQVNKQRNTTIIRQPRAKKNHYR